MTYCPNSDENWKTLSAQEAGFDQARGTSIIWIDPHNDLVLVARWINQEKVTGLIGHFVGALA